MRPTVDAVEDVEDAIKAARAIAEDLGNQDAGKDVDTWSLKQTLARANKIARWASAEVKRRGE